MDFNKLRKYSDRINSKIKDLAIGYDYNELDIKETCREIAFSTYYTMDDAIDIVSNLLQNNISLEYIKKKYKIK